MVRIESSDELTTTGDPRRRAGVLDSALGTFARFGYRKTSMEEVARAAHISRPGLYFLFSSKESLFRAAVEQRLQRDIDAVAKALGQNDQPLRDRLLASFDLWAGRYVGAFAREVTVVIEDNLDLLGALVAGMPQRFEELIIAALTTHSDLEAARRVAQTLISASIGVKYQVDERAEYRDRMTMAITLLVR
jgi:AcrR family transcriptional regulator